MESNTSSCVRVATWLHLEDREEYGDYHLDSSPIAWTREIWKRVNISPWSCGPEDFSRTVAITEPEAQTLLQVSGSAFASAIYRKLGVSGLEPIIGLPKGPYFDPLDEESLKRK